MVVPVSTRSMTASARPKPQAASTDPETYLMPVKLVIKENVKKRVTKGKK